MIPTVVLRWSNRLEVALARRFGWSIVSRVLGVDVAVLETVGATTGTRRRSIVAWTNGPDGDLLIGGGAGGRSQVPDWVANLRSTPEARLTIARRTHDAIAREPTGDERSRALEITFREWPFAADYESRSGRPIPVFLLRQSDGSTDLLTRVHG